MTKGVYLTEIKPDFQYHIFQKRHGKRSNPEPNHQVLPFVVSLHDSHYMRQSPIYFKRFKLIAMKKWL